MTVSRPPAFSSSADFVEKINDADFWRPHVFAALRVHQLDDTDCATLEAGNNATHPTFICGGVVVKFFGHIPPWRRAYECERAAQLLIAENPEITAPRLLASGILAGSPHAGWAYLVTTRMRGASCEQAQLPREQMCAIAAALGAQVKRVHALSPGRVATHEDWQPVDIAAACAHSSLPSHLVPQIDDFLKTLAPFDHVVCHSDLVANHVYIEDGRLVGIIDWGDAMVTDRHGEIIQPYRDLFGCDKQLLRVFLDASDWPVGKHFHRQALGLALHRQAIGLQQHRSMDVFEPVAARFPLGDIATLEELASEMFAM
ncbi:MAG: aminoglycoside phosphotransferase family protein [Betaproteobacteria bacterium]